MLSCNKLTPVSNAVAKRICSAVTLYHNGSVKLPLVFKELITHVARNTPLDTKRADLRAFMLAAVRLTFERAIKSNPNMKQFLVKGFNERSTVHGPKIDDPNYGFRINAKGVFKIGATAETYTYRVVTHMKATSIEDWCAAPDFTQPVKAEAKGTTKAVKAGLAVGSQKIVDSFVDTIVEALIYNDDGKYATRKTIIARIKSLDLDKLHAVA